MTNLIRVLIVDDLPETRENVRKLLQFEQDVEVVGQAGDGQQALELAKQFLPDVILMDINMPGGDGISASQAIRRAVPNAQIIIMSVQSEADYLRKAMLAGARDFLMKPFSGDELTAAIRRVYEIPSAQPAAATKKDDDGPTAEDQSDRQKGKILTVYSPKGGSGCTTIATNIAVGLALRGHNVALVDASFQFGDIDIALKLKRNTTIIDLVDRVEDLETDLLKSVLTDHESGLKVLLSPPRPEMAELVQPDHLDTILKKMTELFDFVIVDTQTGLSDPTLIAVENADRVLLVAQQSLSSLANLRRFFELMSELGHDSNKIMLVVNRASDKVGISIKDVASALRRPVLASILSDEVAVTNAADVGIPLIRTNPRKSRLVASVHQVVGAVEKVLMRDLAGGESAPVKAESAQDQTLFRRLFG